MQTMQTTDLVDKFFRDGYVVIPNGWSSNQIQELNNFCDASQASDPSVWGIGRAPTYQYSQPLLDNNSGNVLDHFSRPANKQWFHLMEVLLGGAGSSRFAEFNLRESPSHLSPQNMLPHRDRWLRRRGIQAPVLPCDYICALSYLDDVPDNESTAAFAVLPKSQNLPRPWNRKSLQRIHGKRGTVILYDTTLVHCRDDPPIANGRRRTLHQYFSRGFWIRPECWQNGLRSSISTVEVAVARPPAPVLTDFVLIPRRLAMHSDHEVRTFFCHWSAAMHEWCAADFPPLVRVGSHSYIHETHSSRRVEIFLSSLTTDVEFHRDLTSGRQSNQVLELADAMLASGIGVEQLAQCIFANMDRFPALIFEALKCCEGRQCMQECSSMRSSVLQLKFVIPMFHEANRIKAHHPICNINGQNSLCVKAQQLDWLVRDCKNVSYQILLIDDGCDRGSGEAAMEIIQQSGLDKDDFQVHFLRDWTKEGCVCCLDLQNSCQHDAAVRRMLQPLQEKALHSVSDSARGGAVTLGLALAAAAPAVSSASCIICTAAADLQVNMAAFGSLVHRLVVGGSFMSVGVRYGFERSVLICPQLKNGRAMVRCFPESHAKQHSNVQISLRHHIRSVLLPEIASICDVNGGMWAVTPETVRVVLPMISRIRKGFDAEFLLLAQYHYHCVRAGLEARESSEGRPIAAAMRDSPRVPTGWIDSNVAPVPILFVEDSPVSNSEYSAVLLRGKGEFLAQLRDMMLLHQEYLSGTKEQKHMVELIRWLTPAMYEILLQDLKVMVSNRMGKHLKLFDPILSSKWLFEWQKNMVEQMKPRTKL